MIKNIWLPVLATTGGVVSALLHSSSNRKVLAQTWVDHWDGHKVKQPYREGVVRKLFFVRHGYYHKDGTGLLTDEGKVQVTAAAKRLKELSQHYRITKIHCSMMKRGIYSMDLIRPFLDSPLPVQYSQINYEGSPVEKQPPEEGKPKKYLRELFAEGARIEAAFRQFFRRPDFIGNPSQPIPPNRPSIEEASKPTMEIYMGHSNLHRYFLCRALQLPIESYLRFTNHPGGFTEFTIHTDGSVECDAIGECGFVEKAEHGR